MLFALILITALFVHDVFSLSIPSSGTQLVLSGGNSPPTQPNVWEDVDISKGWADPRINGGRLLDVGPTLVTTPSRR
jgi:hypothetical protein